MIELAFVVCLSADPLSCKDRSLTFTDDVGLMTCMMGAQAHLAQWNQTYPNERIVRWRCQIVDRSERAA